MSDHRKQTKLIARQTTSASVIIAPSAIEIFKTGFAAGDDEGQDGSFEERGGYLLKFVQVSS